MHSKPRPKPVGPEERTRKPLERQKFNLMDELQMQAQSPGAKHAYMLPNQRVSGIVIKRFSRAFGETGIIPKRKFIGQVTKEKDVSGNGHGPPTETTFWHVDQRRKKGTIADRRKK